MSEIEPKKLDESVVMAKNYLGKRNVKYPISIQKISGDANVIIITIMILESIYSALLALGIKFFANLFWGDALMQIPKQFILYTGIPLFAMLLLHGYFEVNKKAVDYTLNEKQSVDFIRAVFRLSKRLGYLCRILIFTNIIFGV